MRTRLASRDSYLYKDMMTTCFRLSLRSTLDAAAATDVLISLAVKPAVGCFSKIETFFFIFFCYQKNVYDAFCLYIMIYRANNNNNNNALWMLAFIWYCKCVCACVREGVHYCVCVGWPVITISFSVYIYKLLSVKLQYAAYRKHTTPGQSVSERHRRALFQQKYP